MPFSPRNAYYLRISTNVVLPLFVYLDEQHMDWMSDVVLQHVVADLRPLIIPKLQAEKDAHFGPGAAPGTKRGTVQVHRGENYQFAYFFRKTEPHTVLLKSRQFVTAPLPPGVVPKSASPRPPGRPRKRSKTCVSVKQSKRKRAKIKGKGKSYLDEDKWTAEESEEDVDEAGPVSREPRPVRKQHRVDTDLYQRDDDNDAEDELEDIAMESPLLETGREPDVPIANAAAIDTNDRLNLSPDAADIELVVDEEEKKPKPLLQLRYNSFSISGHCLCVVVEPWPPQRTTRLQSVGLGTSFRHESAECGPNKPITVGQREQTPLFFPETDGAASGALITRGKVLPPVPLFRDAMSSTDDDDSGDDLMNFSQTLNAAGHMHAITADDDDDMDGAVLFGDADEVRELL